MTKAKISQEGAPIAVRMQLASAPAGQRKEILSKYFDQAFTAQEMLDANPDLDIKGLGGMDQLFYLENGQMKSKINILKIELLLIKKLILDLIWKIYKFHAVMKKDGKIQLDGLYGIQKLKEQCEYLILQKKQKCLCRIRKIQIL